MPLFGSHLSISGGYFLAVQSARELGFDCVQLFTKNNNRWQGKPLTDDDIKKFRDSLADNHIMHPLSHASYLINLASPDIVLREKSMAAMIDELQRADALGIPYVVFHPGAFTTSSEEDGIEAIIKSLNSILLDTEHLQSYPLLENTAGQGSNLGWKFEQLQAIIEGVREPERLGVCIDTCHAFAAGYPMDTPIDYQQTIATMNSTFGLHRIKAIHLNDSKKPYGSRRDRHEHIGEGEMGLEPFRFLMNDSRFAHVPMYLETEKCDRDGVPMDIVNLNVLRGLIE